ncbi:hypothetical protein [Enterococcus hulanensis]|uniref:hypothetical protein n=1 Tax=Enterococcus hulanensis TaxID=2559929 RepID=UPI0010FA6356|nr:hypothetical protein [Enterococcus hulanensis]
MAEENKSLLADQSEIEWLLFKAPVKNTDIAKAAGMSDSAVGALRRKDSNIQEMRFKFAAALTNYALELKKQMEL